ncbi:MAG: tetratricopeptide repeat protein [Nitrospinota bacterium]|nr:tetratricopeptide repeat protein [Nitrospinota bacterium]
MPEASEEIQKLFSRGLECHQFGLFDDAVDIFGEIIERDPENSLAYSARGSVLSDLGRWEEALENYGRAIEIDPANSGAYFLRGNENLDLGRSRQAAEDYTQTARLCPSMAEASYNKGLALLAMRDVPAARDSFSESIRIDPTLARAYHNRGKALMDMESAAKALEDFDEAIRLTPYDMATYHNRAAALYRLGRTDEARYDFTTFTRRAGPHFKSFTQDDERILELMDGGGGQAPELASMKLITYPKIDRAHRETTLFVDICGSTELVNTYGGFHFHTLFSVLERIFDGHAQANGCVYRKGLGDGFMAIFPDCASAATACVKTMVELIRHNGSARESHRINIRIGMDFGETAVSRNNDRFGIPVNVAKRIEGAMTDDFIELDIPKERFPYENRIFISYITKKSLLNSGISSISKVGVATLRGLDRIRHEIHMIDWREAADFMKGDG